ncbi:hypothetical protein ACFPZ0_11300 [Streptomonospora nanhaiensis]
MEKMTTLYCPECGEEVANVPPRVWNTGSPRPEHSHLDGEPLCAVMTEEGYRPATPTSRRPNGE